MRRVRRVIGMRLDNWLAALILGLCLALLLSGCDSAMFGRGASTTLTPPTPTSTTAPVATAQPAAWSAWTEPIYGYQLQIPGYLEQDSTIAFGTQGEGFVWETLQPGSQQVTQIKVEAATQVHASDCVQGRPITVGSGIPGVENDNFVLSANATPPPNSGSPGSTIIAGFASNGLYIVIQMLARQQSGETFQQEYGSTWQRILASFKPGPTSFGATNPCA